MSALATLGLLATSAPVAAKSAPITGKLSERGYSVIALASDGEATSAPAKRKFRLRPPARRVGLHLRAADGTYAGPIVVGTERGGKRAIVGVRAPAKLGEVEIKAARGYARLAERLPRNSLDADRKARARKGVPVGAGAFGRVRSRRLSGSASDPDQDGIPDPLDVDDDGDLVLDNVDRSTASRAPRSSTPNPFHLASSLALPLYDTVNANSPAFGDERIEAALPSYGVLIVNILPGAAAELDCAGLRYCSPGGTGRYPTNLNPPEGTPFPGSPGGPFDADGDGFGRLTPGPGSVPGMFLLHGARARDPDLDPTVSQIGSGDLLTQQVTATGDESQCPSPAPIPECASFVSTLGFTFATVPALVSFDDETGETTVPYPIDGPYSGPPEGFRPSGPGTHTNGFPVADGPDADQDVELTFTFWRPQRRPIPDELCPPPPDRPCTRDEWIDVGGLTYTPAVSGGPPGGRAWNAGTCPQSSLSTEDPRLTPQPADDPDQLIGFVDQALDQPASPANTFTYTLNLSQCLTALGNSAWEPGQEVDLTLAAKDDSFDEANQGVTFKLQ
jgi:hypothetical protein